MISGKRRVRAPYEPTMRSSRRKPGDLDRCWSCWRDANSDHAAAVADHLERLRERLRQAEHPNATSTPRPSVAHEPAPSHPSCCIDDIRRTETRAASVCCPLMSTAMISNAKGVSDDVDADAADGDHGRVRRLAVPRRVAQPRM
jgi:hypothetical protein